MKITNPNKYIEDEGVDGEIRAYGIARVGREAGVDLGYLSRCLSGEQAMSMEKYERIKGVVSSGESTLTGGGEGW